MNQSFDEFMAEEGIDNGATQRVPLTDMPKKQPTPRRTETPKSAPKRKKPAMSKKDRTTVIVLFSVAGALLLGIIIALSLMLSGPADNELILNNVYVAGVNIGGMTKAQAKQALSDVAKDYSRLNMVVKVLDAEVALAPAGTGAQLDINGVVNAAYDLGRTGSQAEKDKAHNASSHNVSVLPYLNLNEDYINNAIKVFSDKFGTLRSDPKIEVIGNSPLGGNVDETDTETIYQTMKIFTGTAEYDFSATALKEQILLAYDSGIFEVVGECEATPPSISVLDELEKIFKQYCRKASNAEIDDNFNVTPEVYGYGIVFDDVKDMLSAAKYGETFELPMTFIRPNVTAEDIAGNLFRDVLGSYVLDVQPDVNLIANLKLVCKALNEKLLKAGDVFSFNELIGETTRQRGYKPYGQYIDKIYNANYYGGGISQAASALYVSVLLADLDILEYNSHTYAPTFITPGLDAEVRYGVKDFKFENSTEYPIRILMEYKNGQLIVQLLGTDTKDYTVELKLVVDKVYEPATLLQTMPANNSAGYQHGDILQDAITGYDVSVYKLCTPKPPEPEEPEEGGDGVVDGETEPTEPVEPTEPSTEPSTEATEPPTDGIIDPSQPENPDGEIEGEPEVIVDEVFVGQCHYDKRNVIMINIEQPNIPPVVEETEPPVFG